MKKIYFYSLLFSLFSSQVYAAQDLNQDTSAKQEKAATKIEDEDSIDFNGIADEESEKPSQKPAEQKTLQKPAEQGPADKNLSQKSNLQKFSDKKNKAGAVTLGLRLGFTKDKFVFDTPAAHSILSWRDMQGGFFGLDLGVKATKNIDLAFEFTRSKTKGEGTDDDIQNDGGAYSKQKARGNVKDYSLVANFDVYKTQSFKFSPRIGYFYKVADLNMYNGTTDYDGVAGTVDKALNQHTTSKFYGPKVGFKFEKSFSANSRDVLIFDYYPLVQYSGRQFWPQREEEAKHWRLKSINGSGSFARNRGLMTRIEHIIGVNQALATKLYASYEYISVTKLAEIESDGQIFSSRRGNAEVNGYAKWHSFSAGIGFEF